MLVKGLCDLPIFFVRRERLVCVPYISKLHYFKAIVHARHEKVMFAAWRWVPLYTPRAAANISLCNWCQRFPVIEQADRAIIADRIRQVTSSGAPFAENGEQLTCQPQRYVQDGDGFG